MLRPLHGLLPFCVRSCCWLPPSNFASGAQQALFVKAAISHQPTLLSLQPCFCDELVLHCEEDPSTQKHAAGASLQPVEQ